MSVAPPWQCPDIIKLRFQPLNPLSADLVAKARGKTVVDLTLKVIKTWSVVAKHLSKKWELISMVEHRLQIFFVDCYGNMSVNMALFCADYAVNVSLVWHPVIVAAMSHGPRGVMQDNVLIVPVYYGILDTSSDIPVPIPPAIAASDRSHRSFDRTPPYPTTNPDISSTAFSRSSQEHHNDHLTSSNMKPAKNKAKAKAKALLKANDASTTTVAPQQESGVEVLQSKDDSLDGCFIADGSILGALLDIQYSQLSYGDDVNKNKQPTSTTSQPATSSSSSSTDQKPTPVPATTPTSTSIAEVDFTCPEGSLFGVLNHHQDDDPTSSHQPQHSICASTIDTSSRAKKKTKHVAWQDEEESKHILPHIPLPSSSSLTSSAAAAAVSPPNAISTKRIFEHIEKIHDEDSKSSTSMDQPFSSSSSSSSSSSHDSSYASPPRKKKVSFTSSTPTSPMKAFLGIPIISRLHVAGSTAIAPAIMHRADKKPHLRRITPTLAAPLHRRDKYLSWLHMMKQGYESESLT